MLREYLHPYYIKRGLSDPGAAIKRISKELRSNQSLPLEELGTNRSIYMEYVREIQETNLPAELDEKIEEVTRYFVEKAGGKTYDGDYGAGAMSKTQAIRLYALLRIVEPEHVVETGVCNGQSTAFILAALEKQDKGRLHSIDLPPEKADTYGDPDGEGGAVVPDDEEIGWFVPHRLRSRWTLIKGDSRDELPRLLSDLGEIDVFIHDSAHVYDVMMFEFKTTWDHLADGGLLFSHDIDKTNAFNEFAAEHGRDIHYVDDSFGFIIK